MIPIRKMGSDSTENVVFNRNLNAAGKKNTSKIIINGTKRNNECKIKAFILTQFLHVSFVRMKFGRLYPFENISIHEHKNTQ